MGGSQIGIYLTRADNEKRIERERKLTIATVPVGSGVVLVGSGGLVLVGSGGFW